MALSSYFHPCLLVRFNNVDSVFPMYWSEHPEHKKRVTEEGNFVLVWREKNAFRSTELDVIFDFYFLFEQARKIFLTSSDNIFGLFINIQPYVIWQVTIPCVLSKHYISCNIHLTEEKSMCSSKNDTSYDIFWPRIIPYVFTNKYSCYNIYAFK